MFKKQRDYIFKQLRNLVDSSYGDFVCLDIGTVNIKAIYIHNGIIKKYFLEKTNQEPLILIKAWLNKENLLSKPVKIVIKGQETLIRYLPFPKVEKKSLRETISLSLSQFIPFNKDDVYFDVALIKEDLTPKEYLIMLAVCKKNYIDGIINNFSSQGINLVEISLSNVAMVNLGMHIFGSDRNLALIDMGVSSLSINVINKDKPLLSREIKIALDKFLNNIALKSKLSIEEVNKFLFECDNLEKVRQLAEEFCIEIFEEVKNSIDYFELNYREKLEAIYLSGGLAKIKVMAEFMGKYLGVKTEILNPYEKILTQGSSEFLNLKELFAPVVGLSL